MNDRPPPAPGTVTSVRVQSRNTDRVSIYVDDDFSFGMPAEAAYQLGIRKSTELTRDLLDKALQADMRYRARQRALSLLAHRARSRSELHSRLKRAGFDDDSARHAVDRMDTLGFIDDEAFALAYATGRIRAKKMGADRIIRELRQRGVDSGLATRAVHEAEAELGRDPLADAIAQAERYLPRLARAADRSVRYRRLYGFLLRRGFSGDLIRQAIKSVDIDGTVDQ